jgi:glycosyltransferase involved in cell wall biosynthesis
MISIVLPVFNGERFVADSIGSCLAQTVADLELIIVDDASTDATPEIVRDLAATDARIRVVTHVHNRRLSGALNTGLALAQGDLVSWTSDDNLYRPHALEVLADRLTSAAIDIAYSDFTVIDEAEGTQQRLYKEAIGWLPRFNCVGACFLFKRSLFEHIGGYRVAFDGAEDYDFWLRAFSAGAQFSHVPADLYIYRSHDRSMTSALGTKVQVAALQARYEFLLGTTVLSADARARELLHVAYHAVRYRRWSLALQAASRRSLLNPFSRRGPAHPGSAGPGGREP